MSESTDALIAVARAEHAAVFTYGVITAFVSATRRRMVADYAAAHRARRDEVIRAITAAGGTPPEAETGYTLPVEVTDAESAGKVALAAEVDTCVAYRALLERADADDPRRIGVDGLTDAATRAATWRVALKISPATEALPGTPA